MNITIPIWLLWVTGVPLALLLLVLVFLALFILIPAKAASRFEDFYNGNGWYISGRNWTIALRSRWRLAIIKPPGKPKYTRWYFGPFEFEWHGKRGGV